MAPQALSLVLDLDTAAVVVGQPSAPCLETAVLDILAAAAAAALLHLEVRELKLLALVELAALATSSSSQCKENQ